MAQVFEYRTGYRGLRILPPESLAEELARIEAIEGKLTTSAVVRQSESEETLLHLQFEWDNSIAGHQHRLEQARRLIRAVVVHDDGIEPRSYYVHVATQSREEVEGKYVLLGSIIHNSGEYAVALEEAQRRLLSAERAFQELRQLAEGQGGKTEALAIALQGFTAVREALALLR